MRVTKTSPPPPKYRTKTAPYKKAAAAAARPRKALDSSVSEKKSAYNKGLRALNHKGLDLVYRGGWDFSECTQKHTGYISHGYHRYPAKYIPQLAGRLIEENTKPRGLVVDPFGGCGTTAIEAKIRNRRAIVVDVNPVAVMISNAKIEAIKPIDLLEAIAKFWDRFNQASKDVQYPENERIDYWFRPSEKITLARIQAAIMEEKDEKCQNFLLCAFSNILKNCSMWHMKSNKPLYDKNKVPADPEKQLKRQIKKMLPLNSQYYALLAEKGIARVKCQSVLGNAAKIPTKDKSVDFIVTSPPYVTSYEYADLHQLTALWMNYMNNLSEFRKDFIGSSYADRESGDMESKKAQKIVDALSAKKPALGEKVAVYFTDMKRVFCEMQRILKKGGKTSIVIGNTDLCGVKVDNAGVFKEQLQNLGFRIEQTITRRVISKCIPSTRDSKTGKFSSVKNSDKVVYPEEYIIVAEKL